MLVLMPAPTPVASAVGPLEIVRPAYPAVVSFCRRRGEPSTSSLLLVGLLLPVRPGLPPGLLPVLTGLAFVLTLMGRDCV